MEKRHMDTIQHRAEEFAQTGVTSFKRWELKSWFGAERIGKNVWRNISDNIQEKKDGADVLRYETDGEFFLIDKSRISNLADWT